MRPLTSDKLDELRSVVEEAADVLATVAGEMYWPDEDDVDEDATARVRAIQRHNIRANASIAVAEAVDEEGLATVAYAVSRLRALLKANEAGDFAVRDEDEDED